MDLVVLTPEWGFPVNRTTYLYPAIDHVAFGDMTCLNHFLT